MMDNSDLTPERQAENKQVFWNAVFAQDPINCTPDALRAAAAAQAFHCDNYETQRESNSAMFDLMQSCASAVISQHARIAELDAQLVTEANRTANEKLRADQMTLQHKMQCDMHKELDAQLEAAVKAQPVQAIDGAVATVAGIDEYGPRFVWHRHWVDVLEVGMRIYLHPQPAQCLQQSAEPSQTDGMNIGQRIQHVGGRENAAGYIEFGSVAAVNALVLQVLRDGGFQGRYRIPGGEWSSWGAVLCGVNGHEQELRFLTNGSPPLQQSEPVRGPMAHDQLWSWWRAENGLEDCEMCEWEDFEKVVRAVEAKLGITGKAEGAQQ